MLNRTYRRRKMVFAAGGLLLVAAAFISMGSVSGKPSRGGAAVVFDGRSMDEVVIPLRRVKSSSETLEDFGWPSFDFEDHGLIGREPVEEGLTGLPEGVDIQFYGAFELSAVQFIGRYEKPEEMRDKLWSAYDFAAPVDSKVSFINGEDGQGRPVFYFDTDNDEDFADEEAMAGEEFVNGSGFLMTIMRLTAPRGVRAGAVVEFEYQDGGEVKTGKSPVEVYRFAQYIKNRPDPTFPKFRGMVPEYRRGAVEINGELLELAVYNRGKLGTYHAARFNRILWDLNRDGVFENESESAEYYRDDEPFNINGVSLEVAHISPLGDEIALRKADAVVAPKLEVERGQAAPDFAVRDIDGNELSRDDFRGKFVLLDFWSTSCGPCIEDTPLLKAVHERFSDDLVIIGISDDEDRQAVRRYVAENGVQWIQVMDKVDNAETMKKLYNVSGIPKYYLIDQKGQVAAGSDLIRGPVEFALQAWLL